MQSSSVGGLPRWLDQVYSGVTEETRRLQIEKLPSLGDAGNPTENVTDIRSHRKSNKAG